MCFKVTTAQQGIPGFDKKPWRVEPLHACFPELLADSLDKMIFWCGHNVATSRTKTSPGQAVAYWRCSLLPAPSAPIPRPCVAWMEPAVQRLSDTELGFLLNTPLAIVRLCLYQAAPAKLLPERHPCPFPICLPENVTSSRVSSVCSLCGTLQALLEVPIATAAGFHLQTSHCLAFVLWCSHPSKRLYEP